MFSDPIKSPSNSATHVDELEDDMNSTTIQEGSICIDDVTGIHKIEAPDVCASNSIDTRSSEFDISDLNMWREACVSVKNPFKTKGETYLGNNRNIQFEQEQDIHCLSGTSIVLLAEEEEEQVCETETLHKTISLRLNYEDVLSAWSDRGSFWMDGQRPQTVPVHSSFLEARVVSEQVEQVPILDPFRHAAREARVMRYKEKRRSRLFSKKIRYEVRKLNAERRPRMKGRFVRRTDGCTVRMA